MPITDDARSRLAPGVSATPMVTLRGMGPDEGRALVLRTAAAAFNRHGVRATSLDSIAQTLQVTKPVLYSYVRSKDDIILDCIRAGLAALEAAGETATSASACGSVRLRAIMMAYGDVVTQEFGRCVILTGDETLPPNRRREFRLVKRKIDLCFRQAIAEGVADGSIRPCDPKFTAFALAGALSWIARWYDPAGTLSAHQVVLECVRPLLAGLEIA